MQGMQVEIDTGHPTIKSEAVLILLAFVNATLGMFHRYVMDRPLVGDPLDLLVYLVALTFVAPT